jgi:uncharacterized protein
MKQSNYNFFFPLENNDYLAFNALRNGLAIVGADIVKKITSHQRGTEPDMDGQLLAELKKGGFLCEDDFEEYNLLTVLRHKSQYSGTGLGLTIAPTMLCNLACLYCFEETDVNKGNNRMDEKVMAGLIKFVKTKIESGITNLTINWYGGEPTLCMDIIERLSNEFMTLCQEKQITYGASMITNGTLLNTETIEKLKTWHVNSIQVTIDGQKEIHDKRRPFKSRSGESSYERIMANLKEIAGLIPISLRINLDVANKNEALDFIKKLNAEEWFARSLQNKTIFPYYGYVRKLSSSCKCTKDETLKPTDFWEKDLKLKQYFYKNLSGFEYYPHLASGCTATVLNAHVIDPWGNMYKCWNHLGKKEKIVGTIFEPAQMSPLALNYLTESFENDPECKECRYLPICMGGCVDLRINAKYNPHNSKDCASWKYYLEESLIEYYLNKINRKQDSSATCCDQKEC